jgi:hypothetical protein
VVVRLDSKRRLLIVPSATIDVIQKKSPELTQVFGTLQEMATNPIASSSDERQSGHASRRAPGRRDAGRARVSGSNGREPPHRAHAVRALEALAPGDGACALSQVERLHMHESGTFELPASVLR